MECVAVGNRKLFNRTNARREGKGKVLEVGIEDWITVELNDRPIPRSVGNG
ncbi:hypothetical protein J0A67_05210 [Algoriphagus aestuariicola]|uniref:Uncharacterized protein n=1 Tax=Algoriphagus aestuariicola TaxID=1852016 RepID=A0ABS3BLQ6_9BACT|nr:hypothetical protein [Algoriphagus aestuariicola]MBN7800248.1 hypothetical protein [Algoriphagus aestuariicola]